ncbi:MAG: hypothetical protein RL385_3293 [Pseudomonadota bacterium]
MSLRGWCLVLALAIVPGTALAQDAGADAAPLAAPSTPPPQARVALSVSPAGTLKLGGLLTLRLEASTMKGEEVSVPEQSLAPFEVVARRVHESPREDGGQAHAFELDVLALEPGELRLPGIKVRFVGAQGELSEAQTEPRIISVTSPLANEPSAAAKPAAEPVSVLVEDYTLAWLGGGLLAAALIAALTLYIARVLRRRPQPLPPLPPEIPPWQIALQKLSALDASRDAMVADARGAELVEAVGNVVRQYLGERYGFDGLERTTEELMRALETLRPTEISLSKVALLLEQCDLVKFARVAPDAALCAELHGDARGLVQSSIPKGGPG